jgi:hypothetical protein
VGDPTFEPAPSYRFGPGRYQVRLLVVDVRGLTATDAVEIAVTGGGRQPPECAAFAEPSSGPAPLTTTFTAEVAAPESPIESFSWKLGEETVSEASFTRTFETPGHHLALLTVLDQSGLSCRTSAQALALGPGDGIPPRIVSPAPASAACGAPYRYTPVIEGTRPLTFALEGAAPGLALDPVTGVLTWTPVEGQQGGHPLALRASNAAGTDTQRLLLEVECGPARSLRVGCGCAAAGGAPALLLAAFGLLRAARARRARAGGEHEVSRRSAVRSRRSTGRCTRPAWRGRADRSR